MYVYISDILLREQSRISKDLSSLDLLKKGLTICRRIANNEIIDIDELFEIIFNKIFPIPYRIQTYLFFSDLHNNKNT
jgi:hypothetical protein